MVPGVPPSPLPVQIPPLGPFITAPPPPPVAPTIASLLSIPFYALSLQITLQINQSKATAHILSVAKNVTLILTGQHMIFLAFLACPFDSSHHIKPEKSDSVCKI